MLLICFISQEVIWMIRLLLLFGCQRMSSGHKETIAIVSCMPSELYKSTTKPHFRHIWQILVISPKVLLFTWLWMCCWFKWQALQLNTLIKSGWLLKRFFRGSIDRGLRMVYVITVRHSGLNTDGWRPCSDKVEERVPQVASEMHWSSLDLVLFQGSRWKCTNPLLAVPDLGIS